LLILKPAGVLAKDRICLSRLWRDWRSALAIVKPQTVIAWHRAGFRLFWTWKLRRGQPGRPVISRKVRDLIRKMCRENPIWGAPRIHRLHFSLVNEICRCTSASETVMAQFQRSKNIPRFDSFSGMTSAVGCIRATGSEITPPVRFFGWTTHACCCAAHKSRGNMESTTS